MGWALLRAHADWCLQSDAMADSRLLTSALTGLADQRLSRPEQHRGADQHDRAGPAHLVRPLAAGHRRLLRLRRLRVPGGHCLEGLQVHPMPMRPYSQAQAAPPLALPDPHPLDRTLTPSLGRSLPPSPNPSLTHCLGYAPLQLQALRAGLGGVAPLVCTMPSPSF